MSGSPPLRVASADAIADARPKLTDLALLIVAIAAVGACPWFVSFSSQRLMVEIFTVFSIALSWNLLAGYGGLVVVGYQVFVGIGAYALFLLSNTLRLDPWLMLPGAAVFSALAALVFAWPLFRLSGAYFAVATWVVAEMVKAGALNSPWLGGGAGMPLDMVGQYDRWTRNAGIFWAAAGIAIVSLLVVRSILRGSLGLALMSLRDAEEAALACGVAAGQSRLAVWLIAAAIAGCAGAVAYMNTLQVAPDACFSLGWTATAIFVSVLGGIGTIEGPILGTAVYFILRESFAGYGSWYFIGVGALAIVVMLVAPGGAWSLISRRRDLDILGVRRRMAR